eukprot:1968184-Pyramimonas_sp.AAC.1
MPTQDPLLGIPCKRIPHRENMQKGFPYLEFPTYTRRITGDAYKRSPTEKLFPTKATLLSMSY